MLIQLYVFKKCLNGCLSVSESVSRQTQLLLEVLLNLSKAEKSSVADASCRQRSV